MAECAIEVGHGYAIVEGHEVGHAISDEEDDNQEPLVEGEEDDSDEVTGEEWTRYYKQVQESEGFDVDKLPHNKLCHFIVPITNFDSHSGWLENVNCSSSLAIDSYNTENGTNYKYLKALKLNVLGGLMYITFVAENVDGGHFIFQARVYRGIGEHEVELCRLKPEKGVAQLPRKETMWVLNHTVG